MIRSALAILLLLMSCASPNSTATKHNAIESMAALPKRNAKRKLLNNPRAPIYPEFARLGNIQSKTLVGLIINEQGDVIEVIPYQGHNLLIPETIEFAKMLKFESNNPTTPDEPFSLMIEYRIDNSRDGLKRGLVEIWYGFPIGQPNP